MGSKASLQLRDEEVFAIQEETGCKLARPRQQLRDVQCWIRVGYGVQALSTSTQYLEMHSMSRIAYKLEMQSSKINVTAHIESQVCCGT